ncbi:mucin-5AC-like isoform X2 [Gigantopelta aegis]|uniref:mucin-5AC-like isoform X2 n=1 Tax=Gigantopelta aegis TaxID=1735272 RepID=UPI001B88E2CD|nr:mucin-5AC-like isoform X2 [Gigantopelta aegis]
MKRFNSITSHLVLCVFVVSVVSPASFHVQWKAPGSSSISAKELLRNGGEIFVVSTARAIDKTAEPGPESPVKENAILESVSKSSTTDAGFALTPSTKTQPEIPTQPAGSPVTGTTSRDRTGDVTTSQGDTGVTRVNASSSTLPSDATVTIQTGDTGTTSEVAVQQTDVVSVVTGIQAAEGTVARLPTSADTASEVSPINPATEVTSLTGSQQETSAVASTVSTHADSAQTNSAQINTAQTNIADTNTADTNTAQTVDKTTGDCPAPPKVLSASARYQSTLIGSVVFYQCNQGNPPKRALSVCTFEKTWTLVSLHCPATECPATLPVVTGAVSSVSDMRIGSLVVFTCNVSGGYTYRSGGKYSECGQDGAWTLPSIQCVLPAPVIQVSSPDHPTSVASSVDPPQQPTTTSSGQTFLNFSRKSYSSSSNQAEPPTFLNFRRPFSPAIPKLQAPPVSHTSTSQQATDMSVNDQSTSQRPQSPPSAPPINQASDNQNVPVAPTNEVLTNQMPAVSPSSQSSSNTVPDPEAATATPKKPPSTRPAAKVEAAIPKESQANSNVPGSLSFQPISLSDHMSNPPTAWTPHAPSSSSSLVAPETPTSPASSTPGKSSSSSSAAVSTVSSTAASSSAGTSSSTTSSSSSSAPTAAAAGTVAESKPGLSATEGAAAAKPGTRSEPRPGPGTVPAAGASGGNPTTAASSAASAAATAARITRAGAPPTSKQPSAPNTPPNPPPAPPVSPAAQQSKPEVIKTPRLPDKTPRKPPTGAGRSGSSFVASVPKRKVKPSLQPSSPAAATSTGPSAPAAPGKTVVGREKVTGPRPQSWRFRQDYIPQHFFSPTVRSKGGNTGPAVFPTGMGLGRGKPKTNFGPGNNGMGRMTSSFQGLSNARLDAMINQEINKAKSTWGAALSPQMQKFLFGNVGMTPGVGNTPPKTESTAFSTRHQSSSSGRHPGQTGWKKTMTSHKQLPPNGLQPFGSQSTNFDISRTLLSFLAPKRPATQAPPMDAEALIEQQEDILKARALLNRYGQSPLKKKATNQARIDRQLAALQVMEQHASDVPPPAQMLGLSTLFKEPSFPRLSPTSIFENQALASFMQPEPQGAQHASHHLQFQRRQQQFSRQQQQRQRQQSNQMLQQPRRQHRQQQKQQLPQQRPRQQPQRHQSLQLPQRHQKPTQSTRPRKTTIPFDFMKLLMGTMP